MQTTSHILMIRPVNFAFNEQTAGNNAFQVKNTDGSIQSAALAEFDRFVSLLRENEVSVEVMDDTPEPFTPDSLFPNNWISFHEDGTILLYPMFAPNRRAERKAHVLQKIHDQFEVTREIDLTSFEKSHLFLEGTGSMVLDRDNRIAFACLSARTSPDVLHEFCQKMHYRPVVFSAVDAGGQPIYHTNVVMCVADKYVVICLDAIRNLREKQNLIEEIAGAEKEIITISDEQMNHFAGNMLQVQNKNGERLLVMSTQAYRSLTVQQAEELSSYNRIVHSSLNTIETNGGGSARCMMAEIYLPELS